MAHTAAHEHHSLGERYHHLIEDADHNALGWRVGAFVIQNGLAFISLILIFVMGGESAILIASVLVFLSFSNTLIIGQAPMKYIVPVIFISVFISLVMIFGNLIF